MNKEKAKYQIVYFIRFMGDSFFYPFLSLFLITGLFNNIKRPVGLSYNVFTDTGLTKHWAGYLLMLLPLVAIFINPLWGFISKNVNFNKRILTIFSLVEGLFVIFLVTLGVNKITLIVILAVIALAGQPAYSLLDSIAKPYCDSQNIKYLSVRIMGSISYVLGSVLSGVLLYVTKSNYAVLFSVCGILFILTSVLLIYIKTDNTKQQEKVKPRPKEIFKNKRYYLVLLFAVFSLGVMLTFDIYVPNFLKDVYLFSDFNYGFLFAGVVLLEVIIMLVLMKVENKLSIKTAVIILSISLVLRFVIFTTNLSLGFMIAAQLIRGISMAFYLFVFLKLLVKQVKPYNLTLGIIIINSMMALFKSIFTVVGGYMLSNFNNYKVWFMIAAIFSFLSMGAFLLLDITKRKSECKEL